MKMIASKGQIRASFIRWALFLVPAIIALGALSGQVAGSAQGNPWFAALEKPATYPPGWVFGVVWTALYAMMGLAMALVASAKGARGRRAAVVAFVIQLVLNLAWAPLFFGAHRISWAFGLIIVLYVAVIITTVLFWKVRKAAGMLLLPYLAWVLFAAVLNWQFYQANPDLDGVEVSGAVQRYEF